MAKFSFFAALASAASWDYKKQGADWYTNGLDDCATG